MGHILVRLPKNSTQQQVNTVSQTFTSQRDLLVCSHLPSRNAHASIQHLRMLAREEQPSCLLEIFQGLVFNSLVIKAIFLSSMLYHLISPYFGSLCINDDNAAALILQSVVLRCIFPRTEKHSSGMVQSAISLPFILFLSTSWSVRLCLLLLSKLASKDSEASFWISSCLSSRLLDNLTVYPPGVCLFLFKFTLQVVLYKNKIQTGPCKSEISVIFHFVWGFKYLIVPSTATFTSLLWNK